MLFKYFFRFYHQKLLDIKFQNVFILKNKICILKTLEFNKQSYSELISGNLKIEGRFLFCSLRAGNIATQFNLKIDGKENFRIEWIF